MNKLIAIIVCFCCLQTASAQYVKDQNEQYRDISAAGPFPFYLTSHGSIIIGNKDMDSWVGDDARMLNGLGFDLGFKIKRAVFLESGYWHITSSPKDSDDKLTLNTYSLRMGWRKTVFYPFGTHYQLGVLVRDSRFRTANGSNSRTVDFYDWQWGIDGRIKLTLLDPVGTGGGIGFYIEGRANYLFGDETYDLPGDVVFERDNFYGSISLGIMAPIAVRRPN